MNPARIVVAGLMLVATGSILVSNLPVAMDPSFRLRGLFLPVQSGLDSVGFAHRGWPTFVGTLPSSFQMRWKRIPRDRDFDPERDLEIALPYRQGLWRSHREYFFRRVQAWSISGVLRTGILRYECRTAGEPLKMVRLEELRIPMQQFIRFGGKFPDRPYEPVSIYDCEADRYVPAIRGQ